MKKRTKFILAVGLLLMAAGLALWGLEAGAYREETLGPWDTQTLAAIEIEVSAADVRIYDGDNSRLEIDAAGWGVEFITRVSGDTLYIQCRETGSPLSRLPGIGEETELVLWLPRGYAGNLTVTGDSGDVNFHGTQLAGRAEAAVDSGEISVYDSEIAAMTLRSGSGDIFLGDVRMGGELVMDSGSGGLYAEDIRGATACVLTTDSGYVHLMDMAPERLQVTTGSGEVWLEEVTAGDMSVATDSGGISGELEGGMEEYSITAETGSGRSNLPRSYTGGAKRLELSTGSGDIDVIFENN